MDITDLITQPSVSLYVSPYIISTYLFIFLFHEYFFDVNMVITHSKRIIHLFVIRQVILVESLGEVWLF